MTIGGDDVTLVEINESCRRGNAEEYCQVESTERQGDFGAERKISGIYNGRANCHR
ncbi:hypothetical protein KOY48_02305 [Candidatus Minimicrobia naudis]|uniref:Uncharacterized protein n=1 Tax=Candidatus Minimicrobia naudis TaxID=2841263 RepID=A0A8F1MCN6_9BACT|nr:hypothetical protein KOY48_02305 [Candidatus Minimicrobia naudis]